MISIWWIKPEHLTNIYVIQGDATQEAGELLFVFTEKNSTGKGEQVPRDTNQISSHNNYYGNSILFPFIAEDCISPIPDKAAVNHHN